MIIDTHIHIFPPEIVNDRARFFVNEPEFEMLYNNPKARLATITDVITMLPMQKVDKAVLCGFPWRSENFYKMHNDYLAQAQAQNKDQFVALGAFHSGTCGATKEALRCIKLGLGGLGELAFYQETLNSVMLERLTPIMALCAEANLPVLLHANEPIGHAYHGKAVAEISHYYNFCKKFCQNKIILAHWGGGLIFYLLLQREVRETLQNVWFDTAALPYLYTDNVYEICNLIGYEHILFGSDFPLLKPLRYIDTILASNISAEAKNSILGINAKNLFNF